jgi:ATP-dependent metalloprotease
VDYETLNKDEAFKVIKGEKLEGKIIMPSGSIKIPNLGPSIGEDLPVPGSTSVSGGEKEPPTQGGAVA